jgi:hypothetical protein
MLWLFQHLRYAPCLHLSAVPVGLLALQQIGSEPILKKSRRATEPDFYIYFVYVICTN